ncbi:MAG: hypothetical protein VW985_05510 [Gammaproteobacteria bacterium]
MRLDRWSTLLVSLLLLCLSNLISANESLTVLTLKHRPADQLLSTLEPLMKEGNYLTGEGNKLFLRTDPATLEQVQQLLAALDKAPVTVRITVKQGAQVAAQDRRLEGEIRVGRSTAGGEPVKFQSAQGSDESTNTDGLALSIAGSSLSTEDRDRTEQTVTVMEGHEAHFYLSQQIPTVSYQHGVYGHLQPGVEYRSALRGFSVIPRINGEQIQLTVRGQQEKFVGRDTLTGQQIETTLITRSGEWYQLGEHIHGETLKQRGTLLRTDLRNNQYQSILIKAEKIHEDND